MTNVSKYSTLPTHSSAIIALLKGVIYRNQVELWKLVIEYERDIRKYFQVIGIELHINEAEGFAYLKQKEFLEDEEEYSRLVERRQLSYPVSLLCVMLRKKILESDSQGEETKVVVSLEQIEEMLKLFLPDNSTNEAKIIDKVQEYVNNVEKLGFLRKLKNEENKYEITRIIKAYIRVEEIQQFLDKYKEYYATWDNKDSNGKE